MEAHARTGDARPPLSLVPPEVAPRLVSAVAAVRIETTAPMEIVDLTERVEAFLGAVHLETGYFLHHPGAVCG